VHSGSAFSDGLPCAVSPFGPLYALPDRGRVPFSITALDRVVDENAVFGESDLAEAPRRMKSYIYQTPGSSRLGVRQANSE
jgi:hypothetical protein